jgi:flagellar basal body-associated protein FliL
MTNQDKEKIEKSDNRMMWIATAVIVLILVGGMGANMLFHHDTITNSADTDTPSGAVPQK